MSEAEAKENAFTLSSAEAQLSSSEIEKLEEAKLKAKYPMAGRGVGHSAFMLQKKLNKGGQKYFDSGDYQMAKQTSSGPCKKPLQSSFNAGLISTGEEIPTPESVPVRKTSIIQSKFHPPVMAPSQTP
uniref:Alpha-endosulfine n=1 Tax=Lygus hesperus TaxID=30085 RepID=A0A0A9Z7F7_LYGHE